MTLISEAEAYNHILRSDRWHVATFIRDDGHFSLLTHFCVGEPAQLKKYQNNKRKHKLDREQRQVGCDLGLKYDGQGRQEPNSRHDGKIYIVIKNWEQAIHTLRRLKTAKSLRALVAIEASYLEAMRTGEMTSLHYKDIKYPEGDVWVLDSKKHILLPVPLDPVFGNDVSELAHLLGLKPDDFVLPQLHKHSRKPDSKSRGEGLTEAHVLRIYEWVSTEAGLLEVLTPRKGRAAWASREHFILGKPMKYIQVVLRHDHLQNAEHYVNDQIVDYASVKSMFYQGMKLPHSECARALTNSPCPNAADNCYCRGFVPVRVGQLQEMKET